MQTCDVKVTLAPLTFQVLKWNMVTDLQKISNFCSSSTFVKHKITWCQPSLTFSLIKLSFQCLEGTEEEQRYSSVQYSPWCFVEVNGKHHIAAFYPGERTLVPTEQQARWDLQPIRMTWRRDKYLAPARTWTPDWPWHSLFTTQTMLSWLTFSLTVIINEQLQVGMWNLVCS